MRALRSTAIAASVWLLPLTALGATPSWSRTLAAAADGASYGDVDGDGDFEIALIVRGNPGQVVLLDHTGQTLWTHEASPFVVGYPTFGDFDGNGTEEVAYCESSEEGPCRVLNADGTVRYSFGSFYYAGMTGAGPSATDVDGDGADDIIVHSWGGEVVLVDGPTGAVVWTYDAWETYGEVLNGPTTVADLDGDGALEVLFGGWQEGTMFALDAATGTEVWTPTSLSSLWGLSFWANGALVEDLDRDGVREVVVSLDGNPPTVAAFSPTGASLWRTTMPDTAWFSWLTPVASDLDGDGDLEILAQSGDGVLYVLEDDGTLIASPSLGAESWVAPSFIDLDFDRRPEVIAANRDSLLFLDGETFAELDRYDDPVGGIFPQILVGDLGGDGLVDVVTGSYDGESVHHFSLSAADVIPWSALGGSATHEGGVEVLCPVVCASPSSDVDDTVDVGDDVLIGPDVTIGSDANIGDGSTILEGATIAQQTTVRPGVTIGPNATVEQQTFIGTNSTVGEGSTVGQESLVGLNVDIGDDVDVGQQTLIWGNASIGEGTNIAQQSRIGWGASIAEDVVVEQQVVLRANTAIGAGTVIGQQTRIGSNTVIGANVVIGESCRIGRNVVIGDGVVVPDGTFIRNGSVLP